MLFRRHAEVLSLGLLAVATAGALGSALAGWQLVAAVLLAVAVVADAWFTNTAGNAALLLDQASLGRTSRILLRAVVVAVAGLTWWQGRGAAFSFAVAFLAFFLAHCAYVFCLGQLEKPHARAIKVRNIDQPMQTGHRVFGIERHHLRREAPAELAVLVPSLCVASGGWVVLGLAALAMVLMFALVVGPVADVLAGRKNRVPEGQLTAKLAPVQRFIDDYRPEVLLHLSGQATSGYQVNVWLTTLEQLSQRVLIVLRDEVLLGELAPTRLPVVCVRSGADLMSLDLSHPTVALYPTNVGNSIHLLRLPSMLSAFIGHGDSDKNASTNPYSRVYDEIWVAGEAGADRYRKAQVGVTEDQYRRVGRPQISGIRRAGPDRAGQPATLLYAPTWEGWNTLQEYSSVGAVGATLIERALAHPGIRVIYKPHPLTGIRDPRARRAHLRIVSMIEAANRAAGFRAGAAHPEGEAAGHAGSALEEEQRRAVRDQHYWAQTEHGANLVVEGPFTPDLFSAFNQSTALATDISSVLSDYLASEKPCAVYNPTPHDRETFVTEFASASASTIVQHDGSGISEFLDIVAGVRSDELRDQRRRLADYLIGPTEDRSLHGFQRAVDALSERTLAERSLHRPGDAPRG